VRPRDRRAAGRRVARHALVAGLLALGGLVLGALALTGAPVTGLGGGAPTAHAQQVDTEQQLAIERQLLCPQCVNERLDQCELPICEDMRTVIRQQLAEGTPPDQIVFFFRARYGERVLANLPREGFNLLLFGWVIGSVLVMGVGGGWALWRMRRSALARAAGRGR
jgi:cytochrome c-type biogenesis protein CcmH